MSSDLSDVNRTAMQDQGEKDTLCVFEDQLESQGCWKKVNRRRMEEDM